ncbi:MAG: hypothetical protein K0S00_4143 [Xanthobacteraceae bacterium]|nr:hypothetical protein [Xanthobacteraceae bacterium]
MANEHGGYDGPEDETDEEYDAAYEAHRTALYDMLIAYADKEELSDGFMAQLLSDLGLSLRMVAYASETEKPSIGGLRDRYTRELGESVREAKKHAAEFIADAKAAREAEEGEDGEDEAEPDAPRS